MQNKFTHLCNCFEDLPRLPLEHWSKQNSNYARVNLRISVLKKLFAYYSPTTDSLTSSLSVFPWIPYLIWQKKVLESSISRFLILKLARLPGTISTLSRTHSTSLCRLFCLVPLSVLTRMATFLFLIVTTPNWISWTSSLTYSQSNCTSSPTNTSLSFGFVEKVPVSWLAAYAS